MFPFLLFCLTCMETRVNIYLLLMFMNVNQMYTIEVKMTIDTVEQLDEMRARTLCEEFGSPLTIGGGDDFRENWSGYLVYARAIREADERAGLVTIPKHPTDEMVFGAACALDRPNIYMGGPSYHNIKRAKLAYDAMIESSPFSERIDVYVG